MTIPQASGLEPAAISDEHAFPMTTCPAPPTLAEFAEDIPESRMTVSVVRGVDELVGELAAWQRLAHMALEPNPFYEPCMLLPALEYLASDDVEFVIVKAPARKFPQRPEVWCGFFPIRRSRVRLARMDRIGMWKYLHCFLCSPLLRRDAAELALSTFLHWALSQRGGRSLLNLESIAGDGPLHQCLLETMERQGISSWVSERHTRALFRQAANVEAFLLESMSRKRRHEVRRSAKRFAEQGRVEYRSLDSGCDLDAWLNDFLALERQGWKGRKGTALACSSGDEAFFRAMARQAFDAGKLMMTALLLDDRVVAQKCNILSANGGFAFKIAFAEDLARFSPGVLLELHNIERLHAGRDVDWMDSCADADHPMINHLWQQRRTIETLWLAGTSFSSQWALALLPLAKRARQGLRRQKASTSSSSENRPPNQESSQHEPSDA
jgi:hypothetical protein